MGKTREELAQEASEAATAAGKEAREAHETAAAEARDDEQNAPETDEEYAARIQAVRGVMIFGDVDTTAGASASETDVPSGDNEAGTVAVAEADVQAEQGDEDAAELSKDEARRQVDVDSSRTASAQEVDEAADDDDEEDAVDEDDADNADEAPVTEPVVEHSEPVVVEEHTEEHRTTE